MKSLRKKNLGGILSLALILGFTVVSCKRDITELDKSPNQPENASVDAILPGAQVGVFYLYGNDLSRITSMWTQQMAGTDRQYSAIDVYNINETDTDGLWSNHYTGNINELELIIKKAKENGSPHYQGVAQVLLAMSYGAMTDAFGNIPFSEAAKGPKLVGSDEEPILNPKYDDQEQIYNGIITMLQNAKSNLQASNSLKSPGQDDMIYGGELGQWIKAANVLLARYYIHQTNVSNNAAQNALDALSNSPFTGNVDNMMGEFSGDGTDQSNPWFQFNQSRGGYISAGGKMVDTLRSLGDPRIGPFYAGDSAVGSYPGEQNTDASEIGPAIGSPGASIPLVTYVEQEFIRAEAEIRVNNGVNSAAEQAFQDALTASLQMFGVPNSSYVTQEVNKLSNAGNKDDALKHLMLHKWIAMFTHEEAFVDIRRTGYPDLEAAGSATELPRRLPYPVSERNNNSNYPGTKPITQKLWWQN